MDIDRDGPSSRGPRRYEHVGHTRAFDRNETHVREWLATLKGDFVDNGLAATLAAVEHADIHKFSVHKECVWFCLVLIEMSSLHSKGNVNL